MNVAVVLATLTLFSLLALTWSAPYEHRRRRHHRHSRSSRPQEENNVLSATFEPKFRTDRVMPSANRPEEPPVSMLLWEPDFEGRFRPVIASSGQQTNTTTNNQERKRRRRSSSSGPTPVNPIPVCESVGQWTTLDEAQNQHGHNFTVLPKIDVGGVMLSQHFFQISCVNPSSACNGIDSHQYSSVCRNVPIKVYAKVADHLGNEGWTFIVIPGGCECVIAEGRGRTTDLIRMYFAP